MASEFVSRLVAELLVAAAALSGYPAPPEQPEVVQVSHAKLEQIACGRPCRVFGWSPPGAVIYLDDKLDLEGDLFAQSILIHELTHYLQQESGRFGRDRDCTEWIAREREAYLVQYRWLARTKGEPVHVPPGVMSAPWLVSCQDEPDWANGSLGG